LTAAGRDRRGTTGCALVVAIVALAVAAPLVSNGHPNVPGDILTERFLPPLTRDPHGALHLLGTDRFARDVWARLIYGARISLAVGFASMLLSVTAGVAIGSVSAWARGWTAALLVGLTDFALAVPRVVVLLLLAALWRPSAVLVVVFLAATGWMPVARLVHGEVQSLAGRPFVEGAAGLGASRWRVLWRHVVPNALTPVIVAAALGVGNAILLEAGLSYLGLGVQPPTPSWGNMITSGRDTLVNAPWVAAAPGVMLALVVVGCTLLGDAIRDAHGRRQTVTG
jgi:peptide/nickel transport system permease protein